MNKMIRIIKAYPVIWGILGAICTMGLMAGYQYMHSRMSEEPKMLTIELERQETIDSLNDPEQLVNYFFEAIRNKDLDMALRGIALDESIINVSLRDIMQNEGEFYTDMEIAPSGDFPAYNEISALELAGKYSMQIKNIWDQLGETSTFNVKDIDFVKPENQITEQNKNKNQKIMEYWGGDAVCEMMAFVECEKEDYLFGITLLHYEDYWKIFALESELCGIDENTIVKKITREEYEKYKGNLSKEDFMAELAKISEESESIYEEGQDTNFPDMLLPANYFVLHSLKKDSPEQVIREFVLSIQREDLAKAMAYCIQPENSNGVHTTVELIEKQVEIAKQLKRYCYGFLGCDFEKNDGDLDQIGITSNQIINKLDTKYFMYYDIMELFLVDEREDEKQYVACCYYEGNRYLSGFTLENSEGWRITSLSSESYGLKKGENRKITDREYNILKDRR